MQQHDQTAILLFARTPEVEIRHKNFGGSTRDANLRIAQVLLQHTVETVKSTGLPYFVCNEKRQQGIHFGDKLANAIESIYARGFERVIAIGSDSPELSKSHLIQAFDRLHSRNLTLGQSSDGGVYLLGLRKSAYKREIFLNLSWETHILYKELSGLNENTQKNSIADLPELADIDRAGDLSHYCHRIKTSDIAIILLRLVQTKRQIFSFSAPVSEFPPGYLYSSRPPPFRF